jgi:hypothetical protein
MKELGEEVSGEGRWMDMGGKGGGERRGEIVRQGEVGMRV